MQARPNENSEIKDLKISIIIPTYNEEESIGKVLQELEQLQPFLPPTELVVVDDCSVDKTANEVEKFPFVKYVKHKNNRGKGAALRTGLKIATGNILLIQDADLEYPPSNIPKLLEPILNNRADVVYGSRFMGNHDGMSFSHYVGNKILSLLTRLLYRASVTDVMTGHKCFARRVLEATQLVEEGFIVEVELTAKILKDAWRFTEIPIAYSKRTSGLSKIRFEDGIKCMIKLITEFLSAHRKTVGHL